MLRNKSAEVHALLIFKSLLLVLLFFLLACEIALSFQIRGNDEQNSVHIIFLKELKTSTSPHLSNRFHCAHHQFQMCKWIHVQRIIGWTAWFYLLLRFTHIFIVYLCVRRTFHFSMCCYFASIACAVIILLFYLLSFFWQLTMHRVAHIIEC